MSAIAEIIACVEGNTEYSCSSDVPTKRPDEFVTVESTGGDAVQHGIIETGSYAVQCWAASTCLADAMSDEVMKALNRHLTESKTVTSCSCGPGYNFPLDANTPRYQMNLSLTKIND